MPRIRYESWKPGADARRIVDQANTIAVDYATAGYDLTLRQLYYQFVARDLLPNTDRSYKNLGSVLNKARMAGLFDWSLMVDRTRNIAGVGFYQSPAEIVSAYARAYSVDHWIDQPYYVEVWVEKEALAGVVERAASAWDAPYFSCRGYVSQSEMWGAAQRLGRQIRRGKAVVILHLGDHDPSGIDMTRDIRDRLSTFITQDWLNEFVGHFPDDLVAVRDIWADMDAQRGEGQAQHASALEIRRIALNMDQIEEYGPPPNPAKITDSRARDYIDRFGGESWELDALDPATLDALIQSHIEPLVDEDRWDEHDAEERRQRAVFRYVAESWDDLVEQSGEAS